MEQFGLMVGLEKEAAFEGWFCKVDDPKNGLMFSIIWGYSTHKKTKHAFIQFQDNLKNSTSYITYPMEEFNWNAETLVLQIGKNTLSQRGMYLDLLLNGVSVRGDFHFSGLESIQKSFFKPNIMGWLTYFPNECNHSIISMNHMVHGEFHIGEQNFLIQGAHGYIEKDWGTGFPKEYVWLQANDWEKSAVVFSYATVPLLGKFAKGFFLVVIHEGKEYRFTSIEGSKLVEFQVSEDSFQAIIRKGGIHITLKAKQSHPVALASPVKGEMKAYIKESLDGALELTLQIKKKKTITLVSQRASIDVHFSRSDDCHKMKDIL